MTQTNIFDYLDWRGDLTFEHAPFCSIDSLILALYCYQNFQSQAGTPEGFTLREAPAYMDVPQTTLTAKEDREKMIRRLPSLKRFSDIRLHDLVDDVDAQRNIQFSATTFEVPHVGTVVAFRGTDRSLVGWKEDFMLSYECPVPAQSAALEYLIRLAAQSSGPLLLTGHSKGGNLAVYAGACAPEHIQKRITYIGSFDGPGLDDETYASEGYARIQPKIASYIPSGSIVGVLMNHHPDYRIVKTSTVGGILQHNGFTWQVLGPSFVKTAETTRSSQIVNQTVHDWLKTCTPAQRQVFVETVFSMLENSKREDHEARRQNALRSLGQAMMIQDPETRKMVNSLLTSFLSIGVGNSLESLSMEVGSSLENLFTKTLSQAATGIRERMKGAEKNDT